MWFYQQEKTFQFAIMSCKTSSNLRAASSIIEEVVLIIEDNIKIVIHQNETGLDFSGEIGSRWLKQVSASW